MYILSLFLLLWLSAPSFGLLDITFPDYLEGSWKSIKPGNDAIVYDRNNMSPNIEIIGRDIRNETDLLTIKETKTECFFCLVTKKLHENIIGHGVTTCSNNPEPCSAEISTDILIKTENLALTSDNCPAAFPSWSDTMSVSYDLRRVNSSSGEVEVFEDCQDLTLPSSFVSCPSNSKKSKGPHFAMQLGSSCGGKVATAPHQSSRTTFTCIGTFNNTLDHMYVITENERKVIECHRIFDKGNSRFNLMQGKIEDCGNITAEGASKFIKVFPNEVSAPYDMSGAYYHESHHWTMQPTDKRKISLGFDPDFARASSSRGMEIYQRGRRVQGISHFVQLTGGSLGATGVVRSANGCRETFYCYNAFNLRSWRENKPISWRIVMSKPVPYSANLLEFCPFEFEEGDRDSQKMGHYKIPRNEVYYDGIVTQSDENEFFVAEDDEDDDPIVESQVEQIMERLEAGNRALMEEVKDTIKALVKEIKNKDKIEL